MSTEFKREERYIVVKIKDIDNPRQLEKLRYQIHQGCGANTIECVVVESDWPEYETVWKMIRDRVEGRPNELTTAKTQISDLQLRIRELEKEHAQTVQYWLNISSELDDKLTTERADLEQERLVSDKLEKALKEMVAEKCDYMIRNALGNPEVEYTTKMARSALAEVADIRAKQT